MRIFTALSVLLCTCALSGQTCASIEPDAKDGVLVAPQNHHVLYETADVRVIEVTVPPHTQEPFHTHARPAVMYIMQPGVSFMHFPGSPAATPIPNPTRFQPVALFFKPEGMHALENRGDVAFHSLRVEIKHPGCSLPGELTITDPGPDDAVTNAPEAHRVLFDNADIRVLDVINPPHSTEPFHTHTWPGFFYVVQGAPMRYTLKGGASRFLPDMPPTLKIIPLPPDPMHSVENLGDQQAHFIRFELKHAVPPSETR